MRETLVKAEEFKDSPLGKIPKDWEVFKLSEVVPRVEYGISVSLDDEVGIPVLRMNNLKDGEVDLTDLKKSASFKAASLLLQPLDVLFNRTNSIEHVGRTAIWRGQIEPASFASYLVRLIPDQSKLIPEYLNIWLNFPSTQLLIRRYATPGVHQVNINPTNLRKVLIPLPKEVSEQRRIVEIFGSINSTIAHTSSIIAKLKQMKAGLLHDLLTRGLDENGELRDAIGYPEQFKDSPLGLIPEEWEALILEEICSLVTNGYVGPTRDIYRQSGFPYLVSKNVKPNTLIKEAFAFVDEVFQRANKRSILHEGDVLTVQTGVNIGDTCVVPKEFEGANCHALIISRPIPDILHSQWLSNYLNSPIGRKALYAIATGLAHPHLNSTLVRKLRIPVPSLQEQLLAVQILETYDNRIRKEEAYREKLKLQKQGLMHDLLTGKVRVKDADKFTSVGDIV